MEAETITADAMMMTTMTMEVDEGLEEADEAGFDDVSA